MPKAKWWSKACQQSLPERVKRPPGRRLSKRARSSKEPSVLLPSLLRRPGGGAPACFIKRRFAPPSPVKKKTRERERAAPLVLLQPPPPERRGGRGSEPPAPAEEEEAGRRPAAEVCWRPLLPLFSLGQEARERAEGTSVLASPAYRILTCFRNIKICTNKSA